MERRGRIWVTRAQPGADATAARLQALGHAPLVGSLLVVQPIAPPREPPQGFAALAFTSANAVRAFSGWSPERGWPVFAVGASTAEAARRAGFSQVVSAGGDVEALTARIAASPPGGPVLHPCAREAAGDLAGGLAAAEVSLQVLPLYETAMVDDLPAAVAEAVDQGAVTAVLIHSPKGAAALASLWRTRPPAELEAMRLLGLSPACLRPLAHLPFGQAIAVAAPNEAALLERLG